MISSDFPYTVVLPQSAGDLTWTDPTAAAVDTAAPPAGGSIPGWLVAAGVVLVGLVVLKGAGR
jgi:hypothetical protein